MLPSYWITNFCLKIDMRRLNPILPLSRNALKYWTFEESVIVNEKKSQKHFEKNIRKHNFAPHKILQT